MENFVEQIATIGSSYWWAIVAGGLMYLFNEIEDACVRNRFDPTRTWWNARDSWRLKWKQPFRTSKRGKWYHFGIAPKRVERFPYSSTILVFLTDGEHFFQWLKFRAIEVVLLVVSWELAVSWIVGKLFISLMKEKFFSWID